MDKLINDSLFLSFPLGAKTLSTNVAFCPCWPLLGVWLVQRICGPFNTTGKIEKSLCSIKYSNIQSAWKGFVADAPRYFVNRAKKDQICENISNYQIKLTWLKISANQMSVSSNFAIAGSNSKQDHLKMEISDLFWKSFRCFFLLFCRGRMLWKE